MNSTDHHSPGQRHERSDPSILSAGEPVANADADETNLGTDALSPDEPNLNTDDLSPDEPNLNTDDLSPDEPNSNIESLAVDETDRSTDKNLSTENLGGDESPPGHVAALRGLLGRVGSTCRKPVSHAMRMRETTALVRLSDEASDKVGSLIDAGVFSSRGEAAAFFVEEGIKARDPLFRQVSQQLHEMETLRSELRNGAVQAR